MKYLLSIFLLFTLPFSQGVLKRAALSVEKGDYADALVLYRQALESIPEQGEDIRFNMAICYMNLDSSAQASVLFRQVAEQGNPEIRSLAWNNIGYILLQNEKEENALEAFHKALKENPSNEDARYNYELLLKRILPKLQNQKQEEDENNPEQNQNLPSDNEEEDDLPIDPNKTVEYYKEKINYYQNLPTEGKARIQYNDSLPLDRALQLLEESRQNEIRFLQQLRKSAAPKGISENKNKSQW